MPRRQILNKLHVAGVIGPVRRPISEIESDIKIAQVRLSALKRERKSLILSEKAKRQHRDPRWAERLHTARAEACNDPVKAAAWRNKILDSARQSGWLLPDMNPEQRRAYVRLLRKGVRRGEALKVALA